LPADGVYLDVSASDYEGRPLGVVEDVRCLECGTVYGKPKGGSTVTKNPGCPECGYVGWIAASVPVSVEFERRRFAAGRLRPHGA
jgi:hypothetical protein